MLAIKSWGLAPSEFWRMSPAEFWLYYEAVIPEGETPYDKWESLYKKLG